MLPEAVYQSTLQTFQAAPSSQRWALADSDLLQAIKSNRPVRRGPRGRFMKRLLGGFRVPRLEYVLVLLVGAVELARLIRQQGKSPRGYSEPLERSEFIFVGFGAGREDEIFDRYSARRGGRVARVDQTDVSTFGRCMRIEASTAVATLKWALTSARQSMETLPDGCRPWRVDFLTHMAIRLGTFSFMYAWFADVRRRAPNVKEVCFVAADTPAFAAVSAGFRTRYLQHGLIRDSIVLPEFDAVEALTHQEADHFRRRIPTTEVILPAMEASRAPAARDPNLVLVASVYGSEEALRPVVPALEFLAARGMRVVVRPHPREDRRFWSAPAFPFQFQLDDGDPTFDDALTRLRPTFVLSWFSTALVDALNREVIPVTVSPRSSPDIQDLVYPLMDHCLRWPDDRQELEAILDGKLGYGDVVETLRSGRP